MFSHSTVDLFSDGSFSVITGWMGCSVCNSWSAIGIRPATWLGAMQCTSRANSSLGRVDLEPSTYAQNGIVDGFSICGHPFLAFAGLTVCRITKFSW